MAFKASLVQLRSGLSPERNLATTIDLIRLAASEGATYVQTPENTNIMAEDREALMRVVHLEAADPTLAALTALARELRITLHIGSLAIKLARESRVANRAFVIAPDGSIAARYDKIHMFDVDLPNGEVYRESEKVRPGRKAVVVGLADMTLGLNICYDLRFPHLARALAKAGANVLTYPAAFTKPTGEAHWHVLQRARAIETGSFVLSAAQGGVHENGRATFGHSIAIDPWGAIIGELGIEPGVVTVEIDPAQSVAARGRIPALRHDRPFALEEFGAGIVPGSPRSAAE
jgi:deaminated glutathione amidase